MLIHVGLLLLGASWAFGGGADWARTLIAVWGSLGLLITIAAYRRRPAEREIRKPTLLWLVPFVGLNVLVLASCLNPSFSVQEFAGQSLLAHSGAAHPQLPSTAHVATSLEHLWLFDAIYLSCFNLLLAVRHRRALRTLLKVVVGNAVLLSIFGTFQKLGSNGLYFGSVPSPNARFFATFVYANHWAAYLILLLAAAIGLLFHAVRRSETNDFAHSPLPLGIISIILMAITPVLAGSRSGTILVLVLLGAWLAQVLWRLRRRHRAQGTSSALPAAGLAVCAALSVGAAFYLGREALQERWEDTQGQWQAGILKERLRLYSDTWQLAEEQPAFGWGLGNFDKVLQLIRPRPLEANRQYEHSYVDAHSDWLQSLAEVGFIGTALLILCGLGPLLGSRIFPVAESLPAYLLGGCGLILLYAAVEFPFGNPAVVIAFWTCFFCALQYARLSHRLPLPERRGQSPAAS